MNKRPEDQEHGEGNHKASREFYKDQRDFVASGKADAAAQNVKPKSDAEARELEEAERAARARSKGEEPALTRRAPNKAPPTPSKTQR